MKSGWIDPTGVQPGRFYCEQPGMDLVFVEDLPPLQMPLVPLEVSRYQARAVLTMSGLIDDVNAYYAALPADNMDKLAWDEAPTVHRMNPGLLTTAAAIGLTSAQVDDMFIWAATF